MASMAHWFAMKSRLVMDNQLHVNVSPGGFPGKSGRQFAVGVLVTGIRVGVAVGLMGAPVGTPVGRMGVLVGVSVGLAVGSKASQVLQVVRQASRMGTFHRQMESWKSDWVNLRSHSQFRVLPFTSNVIMSRSRHRPVGNVVGAMEGLTFETAGDVGSTPGDCSEVVVVAPVVAVVVSGPRVEGVDEVEASGLTVDPSKSSIGKVSERPFSDPPPLSSIVLETSTLTPTTNMAVHIIKTQIKINVRVRIPQRVEPCSLIRQSELSPLFSLGALYCVSPASVTCLVARLGLAATPRPPTLLDQTSAISSA
mmetsp:Transcript_19684/g.37299  ORF Transcript_19684/g.37299 Transcript_19684/m.37299 type:complete len:309 (-) Transcript_19684:688-1614(-)